MLFNSIVGITWSCKEMEHIVKICEFKFHIDILVCKLRQKMDISTETKLTFPWPVGNRSLRLYFLSVLDYRDVIYRHASQFITLQSDSLLVTATPPIIAFCTRRWDGLHYLWDGKCTGSYSFIKSWKVTCHPNLSILLSCSHNNYTTGWSVFFFIARCSTDKHRIVETAFSSSAAATWNILEHNLRLNTGVTMGTVTANPNHFAFKWNCF